jgi:hypothetical protein
MSKVYVGDIGTQIILDCGSNITAATGMAIKVKKPSGDEVEWTGVLDGTNSVKYILEAGDLDEPGTWILQAYVELATWEGLGESYKLKVYAPYT